MSAVWLGARAFPSLSCLPPSRVQTPPGDVVGAHSASQAAELRLNVGLQTVHIPGLKQGGQETRSHLTEEVTEGRYEASKLHEVTSLKSQSQD